MRGSDVRPVHFLDEETGLPCRWVVWEEGVCWGYVGVSAGHPYYRMALDECPVDCQPPGVGCAHSPAAVLTAPDGVQQAGFAATYWWFAFPCADDWATARAQIHALAAQLARMRPETPSLDGP